jgi:phosphoenolpyruvate carboxylase
MSRAQGETLEQQFGEKEVCFRTLDLYTSAVLESSLNPSRAPKAEFRDAMDDMAKARLFDPHIPPR